MPFVSIFSWLKPNGNKLYLTALTLGVKNPVEPFSTYLKNIGILLRLKPGKGANMIEIIGLVFFSRKLRPIILRKGESNGKWITLLIISWFVAEFLGVFIGIMIFGEDKIAEPALIGYVLAFSSFYVIRAILNNKPDAVTYEQLIDQIGTEQTN